MREGTRRASAPGRATVLGEHTDYNGGTSLGIATTERTVAVATCDESGQVEVRSEALGLARCRIAEPTGAPFGVVTAHLARAAGCAGATIEVTSDVPVGAGLSSSAAFAVAVALALGVAGDDEAVATACQAAERAAGSDVGLLDPLVVLSARAHAVVHLDFADAAGPVRCSTLALPEAIGLTVLDTGVRREVATSAYAVRREECARASALLGAPLGATTLGDAAALRDLVLRRRARHVVTECTRVAVATDAIAAGDVGALGELLDEGHRSLRDDFEVSTTAVEAVRAEVRALRGVTGARLCGAGFGGCLVVAHDPLAEVTLPGRWSSRVPGGAAAVSWR